MKYSNDELTRSPFLSSSSHILPSIFRFVYCFNMDIFVTVANVEICCYAKRKWDRLYVYEGN